MARHTASNNGLVTCIQCHKVNPQQEQYCYRCHAPLHQRRPRSMQYAWAWLVVAAILVIPANVFPITRVITFGFVKPETIWTGIVTLTKTNMTHIAVIVFIASILVPIMKIIGLTAIYTIVQLKIRVSAKTTTNFYHFIHWIGRWSMLDLLVISLMGVMLNMGQNSFDAGPATTAFGLTVICTMFSSRVFDTRLLWDIYEPNQ